MPSHFLEESRLLKLEKMQVVVDMQSQSSGVLQFLYAILASLTALLQEVSECYCNHYLD